MCLPTLAFGHPITAASQTLPRGLRDTGKRLLTPCAERDSYCPLLLSLASFPIPEISKVLLLLYEKRAQEGTGEQALACEILILLPQLRNAPPTNPSPSSCVPFLLYLSWEDAASVGPGPQAGSQQLGTPIVYDKNFECPPRGFLAGGISPASGKWNLGWGPTASMPHPTCPARSGGGPLGSSILGRRWLCSPDPQRRVALWR